jgi:hypothetical protein
MSKELTLTEFAGQGCDVKITIRSNGTAMVSFTSKPGYGYPILEDYQISRILKYIKTLKK